MPSFEYVLGDFEFVCDGREVAVVPYGGGFEVVGVDKYLGGVFVGATLLALVKMTVAGWGVAVGGVS